MEKEWHETDIVEPESVFKVRENVHVSDPGVFYFAVTYCPHEGEKYDHKSKHSSDFQHSSEDPHVSLSGEL